MKSYYRHDYGASQRPYHRARRRRAALAVARRGSVVLAVAGLAALLAAAWSTLGPGLAGHLAALRVLRLEEVVVTGTAALSKGEVLAAAGVQPGGSLVGLDLEAARRRLAAHPRVRAASLRRRLPGTLFVDVAERVPCAVVRAGRDLLVDAEGAVVGPAGAAEARGLPVLTGVETEGDALTPRGAEDLAAGLELVAGIRQVGFPALQAIDHIDLADPDDALIVPVTGRPLVHAGRGDAAQRLARWRLVAPDMARRWAELEYVDLRAEGQVVAMPAAPEPAVEAGAGSGAGPEGVAPAAGAGAKAAAPPAKAPAAKGPAARPKATGAGRAAGGGHA